MEMERLFPGVRVLLFCGALAGRSEGWDCGLGGHGGWPWQEAESETPSVLGEREQTSI